jgi:hypothetical protein
MRKCNAVFDTNGNCDLKRCYRNRDFRINVYSDVIPIRRPDDVFHSTTQQTSINVSISEIVTKSNKTFYNATQIRLKTDYVNINQNIAGNTVEPLIMDTLINEHLQ